MNRRTFAGLTLALVAILPAVAGAAAVRDVAAGALRITDPWSRPAPGKVGAGYMTVTNTGPIPDRLIGGESPLADRLEIHEMSMDGGVMRMRKLDRGLTLAPDATVRLEPGGYHIMLIGLKRPLKLGQTVPATLRFERAGAVKVVFTVQQPPQPAAGHGDHR